MADCIFCRIVAGASPAHVVDEDEHCLAFLDIMPFARGHTLVIPKSHTEDFWTVDVPTAQHMIAMAHRVAAKARDNLDADGLNLFQATTVHGWQTVFHIHYHVIPRWEGDGFDQPAWARPMEDPDVLAATAAELRG